MKEKPPIIQLMERVLNEYADYNGKLNIQISFDADVCVARDFFTGYYG